MRKFLNVFALICVLVALFVTPITVLAAGAGAPAPDPVVIDWGAVLTNVLMAVLPILVAALTTQALVSARYWWNKLEAEKPQLADLIRDGAKWAVPVVEQLKKNGTIPDNDVAKEWAEGLVKQYLEDHGCSVDVGPYFQLISQSIEGALNEYNQQNVSVLAEIMDDVTTE